MAMIKCPECGKEFSDKAAACPNCGCPISEVKKNPSTPAEKETAAKQILLAVDRALAQAQKANASFEMSSEEIQNTH